MACRGSFREFPGNAAKPRQLDLYLLNHKSDHPNRFVIGMPDFPFDFSQRLFFTRELMHQEFAAALELMAKNAWARLPRQSEPREERGPIALNGPGFAFERLGEGRAALCRSGKNAAFRAA